MENFDYEKAYKAVLQTATQWIKDGCTDKERICLECVFPELRESEDEKIRKWLVDYFSSIKATVWIHRDITCEQILDWLEKQKEQKPCKDSGTEGDIMQYIEEGEKRGVKEVISFPEKYGLQKKQKPVLAHDENGDAILSDFEAALFSAFSDAWQTYLNGENVNVVEWAKEHAPELIRVAGKPTWSEEDEKILADTIFKLAGFMGNEKNIAWLKSLRPQSKQEWSEENEEIIANAIKQLYSYANSYHNANNDTREKEVRKVADELKSLRPSWKPSEEQMDALLNTLHPDDPYYLGLKSLYEQLKKL